MRRTVLLVLDSVGIGGAADAGRYGDMGADTIGHIAERCVSDKAGGSGRPPGPLALPNLDRLGLGNAAELSTGNRPPGLDFAGPAEGLWGYGVETSRGKDTPSGHWEIAGVPVTFDWGYFPDTVPAFPDALTAELIARGGLPGILGNRHASGTAVIEDFGVEHIETGKPICYTSADSVLQIAAHETCFGLERLYRLCGIARELVDPLNIGRVIARPFIGDTPETFKRTANRRDYAVPPPEPTLLDRLKAAGRQVTGIGKIGDIFAHRGLTAERKAAGNDALFDATVAALADTGDGGLVFANLVDFDTDYGHRRDPFGYALALEAFDRRLPELRSGLSPGDLAVITADHGCDPTWRGTDHTREHVPILAFGPGIAGGTIGARSTFADIGASLAVHLGLPPGKHGRSFLQ